MWNRGHVVYVGNLVPDRIQRTDGRFTPRTRSLDPDLQEFQPVFQGLFPCTLRGSLCGKRRALARPPETGTSRSGPCQCITLPVRDRHNGIVERGMNVRHAIRNGTLCFLS